MVWTREEYLAYMTFHDVGRDLFCELFGPLEALDREWRAAGVSEDERTLRAFGWDGVRVAEAGGLTGAVTGIEPKVLLDNAEERLRIDHMGRRCRLCKASASIELPMDFPVKTPDDWERVKRWYEFSEDRIDREQLQRAKKLQREGYLVVGHIPGGFDELRELMGEETLCVSYYEEPEMIEDMLTTMSRTALKVFERVCDVVVPDQLSVHEDMAGKSGPLAGPAQVREFIKPYYLSVWTELKKRGATLFAQDSDGNMNAVIEPFLESGLNVMYPFEPAAGMDMVEARRKYGHRLAIMGGIDKHALRGTKEDIERELKYKLCAELRGGGTAFSLDHRIPNGVSMENYRYYVNLGRELLDLPPCEPLDHIRMAF